MKEGISIVIPAYHEAENLRVLLPAIHVALSDLKLPYEILVVDTMTPTDDTKDICLQENALCIQRENGNFYGDAISTGIRRAQYAKTAVMDADGSHDPKDIVRMYDTMRQESLDLVIGSRYIRGGNSHNGPVLKLMSLTVNLIFRTVFQIRARDVSNSFRLYDSGKLKQIPLECRNFDIVEEILIKLRRRNENFRMKEIPIFFARRKAGKSKRNLFAFACSYLKTIWHLYRVCR